MTDAELDAWGEKERDIRMRELAEEPTSADELKRIQDGCEARRKAVGLTRGQAACAVRDAIRRVIWKGGA